MDIETILPAARKRFVTVTEDAALVERTGGSAVRTPNFVVVCDGQGAMRGVVSKTDVVNHISHCAGASCTRPVAFVMRSSPAAPRPFSATSGT